MISREIGGFFELELNIGNEYHINAIHLNSARYCLQYILKAGRYKKIYIPYYICDSVLEPIIEENVNYEYYLINDKFEPVFNKKLSYEECFLYVNYFGMNSENVYKVKEKFKNVIIDNTQAFFEMPLNDTDTIYSTRKFFGVSDGGYLYTNKLLDKKFEEETSYDRYEYLLKRIDMTASESYELFKKNEEYLSKCGIKKMSRLTCAILSSVDYSKCKSLRNENFLYLHENFKNHNELKIDISNINGPMFYPLLINDNNLRNKLIKNKIYVATYWNEIKQKITSEKFEYYLTEKMIPIPIDQRYNIEDMKFIIKNLI